MAGTRKPLSMTPYHWPFTDETTNSLIENPARTFAASKRKPGRINMAAGSDHHQPQALPWRSPWR